MKQIIYIFLMLPLVCKADIHAQYIPEPIIEYSSVMTIDKPYDQAWNEIIKVLQQVGIPLKQINKDNQTIFSQFFTEINVIKSASSGSLGYLTCLDMKHVYYTDIDNLHVKFFADIKPDGDKTNLSMYIVGISYVGNLFDGFVKYDCVSTGQLENQLLSKLSNI